jgi:hypothetical protein
MSTYKTKLAQASKLVEVQIGKVKLPVRSVSAPFVKETAVGKIDGYQYSILINFDAYDPRNKERIMDAFEQGELDEADISGMTFTHEILVTDSQPNPVLPTKGDTIEAIIDFAMKNGEFVLDKIESKKIMNVKSYSVPVARTLKSGLFSKAEASDKAGIPNTSEVASTEKVDGAF